MKIRIIKECNFPIDSIQDLGKERNENAIKNGFAVEVKEKKSVKK